jgi:hypothetical protein
LGDAWPVKRSASCQEIADWAKERGCRYTKGPQIGDLLVIWFPKLKRFAHICLVIGVNADGSVLTRDGNTNSAGGREGWLVAEKTRRLGAADRLVRWTEAL